MNNSNKINPLKICICMPFYNADEYISESLNSIKKQNYDNWELYIYDDGSADKSYRKLRDNLKSIEGKYTLIKGKHVGTFLARIEIYKIVQGDICLCIDADDVLVGNNVFSKINETFIKQNADLVYFNITWDIKDKRKADIFLDKHKFENDNHNRLRDEIRQWYCDNNPCVNGLWNKAFKTFLINDLLSYPVYNIVNDEDRLHVLYLLDIVKKIYILNEVLYYYRNTKGSVTNRLYSEKAFNDTIKVEEQVYNISKKWNNVNYSWTQTIKKIILIKLFEVSISKVKYRKKKKIYKIVRDSDRINWYFNTINIRDELKTSQFLRFWLLKNRLYLLFNILCRIIYKIKKKKL